MDEAGIMGEVDRDKENVFPIDVGVLLGIFVALLLYFQYTTLAKFSVLKPAVRYVVSRDILQHIQSLVLLDMWDAIVFGLIASLFVCGVILEVWKARLTQMMRWVFVCERRAVVALLVLSLVCVRFYFAQGVLNWAGDGSSHICYAWLASHSFSNWEIPIWTNFLGTGSPYLQFYGILYFYTVGLLDQLVRDLDVTMKLVLAGAHILSGLGMYFFVRRLLGSRRAAFVAGLAYVLCLWHTQQVLIMGRFPLALFYAILPWPFYAFERLRLGRSDGIVWGGLALGLLAFVHPGYAFWATAALGFYGAIRVVSGRTRLAKQVLATYGFMLWGLGIVFGAYTTLSMWVERANVELDEITHANVPDPTWGHLLVWSNYRIQLFDFSGHEHWYGGYLGLSLVLLSLMGLCVGITRRNMRHVLWAGAACWIVSLILVLGYRWPGIRSLALIQAFNAGRYLLFVAFWGAVMAGIGAHVLMRLRRVQSMRIVTGILLVVLVDLGMTTFQHPYVPESNTFLALAPSFYEEVAADKGDLSSGEIPNFRLSYPMDNMFDLLGIAWFTTNMGVPSYLTGYREGLPALSKFCGPVQDLMNRIFKNKTVSGALLATEEVEPLRLGLSLLNAHLTYVLEYETQELVRVVWPNNSPIVVAPEARVFQAGVGGDRVAVLEQMMREMDVNVRTHTSQRILLADGERSEHLGTSPQLALISHQVWNQRVLLNVRVTEPCFARLAYAYYPYLGVYVNGERITPYRTAGDFIALKLGAGVYEIELKPHLSPLRRFFLVVDILIVIGVGVWWWRRRKRDILQEVV